MIGLEDEKLTDCRTRTLLLEQFDMAWALAWYHLEKIPTEECLWEPAATCIHVRRANFGEWRPDWPEIENYEMGPPSIAWTTWHICYWWTKAIAHLEGNVAIEASDVPWPGDAENVRLVIQNLHDRWRTLLQSYDESALQVRRENSWPIPNSSPDSIAAWLNVELMKNAAEIGSMRFLYAVS
ncbi:DinB family protein [Parasphingorhabdus sp.]|uniref:DinB family protein n=1 Tax=Parasphingorhabdus sp. TaxID=2709688 RepID=UPI0030015583